MKKALPIASVLSAYLVFTSSAFALTVNLCPAAFGDLCDASLSGNFVSNLINWLFVLAIILAVIYLIWGGIKWIMSGGDKQGVTQAREHIIAAIIGLVVVFLAYFIINFVLNWFGLSELSSSNQGSYSLPGL